MVWAETNLPLPTIRSMGYASAFTKNHFRPIGDLTTRS